MSSRSVVTGVTLDIAEPENGKSNWLVRYTRNKRPDWMYIYAVDELDAFKKAKKYLAAMDKKEDEACRTRKR